MLCVLCVETRDSPDHLPLGGNVKPAASTPGNFNWNDRGGGGGEGKFDFVSEFGDRESLEARSSRNFGDIIYLFSIKFFRFEVKISRKLIIKIKIRLNYYRC